MIVWWLAIDENGGNASYENLRQRQVIAQGWSQLGDLTEFIHARNGQDRDQVIGDLLERFKANYDVINGYDPGRFARFLFDLKAGDIVVGIAGTVIKGICKVTDQVTYQYQPPTDDQETEYAHTFGPVVWHDWERVSGDWAPNPPARSVPIIAELNNHANEVATRFEQYLNKIEQENKMSQYAEILDGKKQLIFTGPPGTGKTREAKRLAYFMLHETIPPADFENTLAQLQNNPNQQAGAWDIIQFHPSYNYDDFVRGIRVQTDDDGHTRYTTEDGPLLKLAEQARNCPDKRFILIIDEINRANVAAVLGEFIYALEYRGESVALQYARKENDRISIPKNLYIIGTMNSADRSIGHLDYAVRRRFAFVDLLPNQSAIEHYENFENNNVKEAALQKYEMVRSLFEGNRSGLTGDYQARDVQPGHSYFLVQTIQELNLNLKYQIAPLLREYIADGVLKPSANEQIDDITQPIGEQP